MFSKLFLCSLLVLAIDACPKTNATSGRRFLIEEASQYPKPSRKRDADEIVVLLVTGAPFDADTYDENVAAVNKEVNSSSTRRMRVLGYCSSLLSLPRRDCHSRLSMRLRRELRTLRDCTFHISHSFRPSETL